MSIINSHKSEFFNFRLVQAETGEILTGRQLYDGIMNLADSLRFTEKKLIALVCDNSSESVSAYFAAVESGNALMLINSGTSNNSIDELIKRYRPEIIMVPTGSYVPENYEAAVDKFYRPVYFSKPGESEPIWPDTALLLTTSGSTGSPKLVRLTDKNLLSNAESIADYLRISDNDTAITSLPMSYSYGLSVINSHAISGARLIAFNGTIVQAPFWKAVKEYGVTAFQGVPYNYAQLEMLRFAGMNIPSLRVMTQAGGKLDADRIRRFGELAEKKGFEFVVMYGQTEATARISYVPFGRLFEKTGSCGIVVPGGRLSIEDENGKLLPSGTIGEVVYEGPNVMLGYAESRVCLSKGDELGGKLRTGDCGKLDDENFLYITGRLKRFVKITGQRINLDEVEQLLEKATGLKIATAPSDNELRIFAASEKPADETRVITEASQILGLHSSLIKVIVRSELPVTSSGKKDYAFIGEMFE